MSKNIILVGNPNTGKTTLFNTLTNSNEKASNWHGVTVGVKSKEMKCENENYLVNDLPGLYSLDAYSNEEKIAVEFLKSHKDDLIVNICDANNLKRNLILTSDLINNGYNIVVAVNMSNEVNHFDYNKLSKELGVVCFPIDARIKKSVKELIKIVANILNKKPQKYVKVVKKEHKIDNINNILSNCTNFKKYNLAYKYSDKIDKIILNKWLFLILFGLVVFFVFYITFGSVGSLFSSIISSIFNCIFTILRKIISCTNISLIIKSLIIDGLFVGFESVISFIPQIVLLMFFINLLEDIGFMSRVAFMFDGLLKKIGLTGKSLFSLMMGYGCTTSAVMTTRNLENQALRKRTVFLLPFMSCSAKLPIFLVISSLFFDKYKYLFVFALYIFAILISILFAGIYKKFIPDKESVFILEMPKFRLPNLKKIIKDVSTVIIDFLIKIGTMILFFTCFIWILQNFSYEFKFLNGTNFEKSLLYFVSEKLLVLFKPLGFESVGIVVALILGVIAKEMIVVGLAMINGVAGLSALTTSLVSGSSICSFTPTSSLVFLIFVLIYSPCLSAIFTIKNELGMKSAIYVFVAQFLIAYVVSFFTFKIITDFRFIFALLFFLILDILLMAVLKLKGKKKCWGNCNACRRI